MAMLVFGGDDNNECQIFGDDVNDHVIERKS